MLNIVIFAMIAAFLALRLYSVLGKRTGHEPSLRTPFEPPKANPTPELASDTDVKPNDMVIESDADVATREGLRKIAGQDGRFNPAEFLDGARGAYEMILKAYWEGDVNTIRAFANEEVSGFFEDAIKAREVAGEVYDNRLVRIDSARITNAGLQNGMARLEVEFTADIAAVTRDKKGKVTAGSLTDAITTHDIWTFERPVRSGDPNWILVDTDDNNE